jgi:hypothetical protein
MAFVSALGVGCNPLRLSLRFETPRPQSGFALGEDLKGRMRPAGGATWRRTAARSQSGLSARFFRVTSDRSESRERSPFDDRVR